MKDLVRLRTVRRIGVTMNGQTSKRRLILLCAIYFTNVFYPDAWFRLQVIFVGREWQGMFVEAREKVVKSVTLARCLQRDIEKWPVFNKVLEESLFVLKVIIVEDNVEILSFKQCCLHI